MTVVIPAHNAAAELQRVLPAWGAVLTNTNRPFEILVAQVVAIPVIEGGSATASGGEAIENLVLECGNYRAFWDGKYQGTSREAASGVYLYRLEIDGHTVAVGRMFRGK